MNDRDLDQIDSSIRFPDDDATNALRNTEGNQILSSDNLEKPKSRGGN
jgi:hypothetical protein